MQVLWIPLAPIGKGRPRAGKGGRIYTPAKTREWERACAEYARMYWQGAPHACPVSVHVAAYHPRPKSRPKAVPAEVWATGGPVARPSKPDASNILKIVEDALNGICWQDDAQIVDARVQTWYSGDGDSVGGVKVGVEPARWSP